MSHEALRWLHVVTFALWFGTDLGVFAASRLVTSAAAPIEARRAGLALMSVLDVFPRVAMLGVIAFGPLLAAPYTGVTVPAPWAIGWIALVGAWAWLAVWLHLRHGDAGAGWRRLDLLLRLTVIGACAGLAVGASHDPARAWLVAKLLLLATAIAFGLGVRRALRPFGPAFAELLAHGSSEPVERRLRGSMRPTRAFVVGIYACVLTAAWLGVARPAWP